MTPCAPAKQVRAIQTQANGYGSDSESDGSGGSDSDIDSHRRIFLAANEDVTPKMEKESADLDPRIPNSIKITTRRSTVMVLTAIDAGTVNPGSTRILCGKRGHPSDHCLSVCHRCGELHDMGKYPMEEFYNQTHQWINPTKHINVKLGRLSGWNLMRAERSRYCIKFLNKPAVDQVSKRPDPHGNTCDLHRKHTFAISSLRQVDEYARSEVTMSLELQPGASRGYWRQQDPGLWFKPTDRVGIGENVYRTEGRTRIKVTLAGSLMYFFHIWVGDLTGQQTILAGIRLDLNGSVSLPDEVWIQLSGTRQRYSDKAKIVNAGQYLWIQAGESVELPLRLRSSIHDKLWVTRGDQWVPTISDGPGRTKYISITNIGDETSGSGSGWPGIMCHKYQVSSRSALSLHGVAESSVGSHDRHSIRRYGDQDPARTRGGVIRRLKTTSIQCQKVKASQDQDIPDCLAFGQLTVGYVAVGQIGLEIRPLDLASVATEESDLPSIADGDSISHDVTIKEALEDLDQVTPDVWATDPSLEETSSAVETQQEGLDGTRVANQDQLHSRGRDQGTSPSKCDRSDPLSMMRVQSGTGHVAFDPGNYTCVASMTQRTDMYPPPVVEDQPGASELDLTWDPDRD
ncbi:hypothetical protein PHMEG_0008502 [Phytophthora megakarya]|uniref:Eukaryotic/viral aspartic protease n=1 Tax=Phytophthora megakarya TaxID=4795 RepID=A0A225WL13_9STRA|nr:hypothetical protein PHMEG_0008502 [Phytophthora megakarya]